MAVACHLKLFWFQKCFVDDDDDDDDEDDDTTESFVALDLVPVSHLPVLFMVHGEYLVFGRG